MRLRTQLFSGLLLLFIVISLLAIVGGYVAYKLEKSSEGILADNFASIDYTVEMLNALNATRQAQQIMVNNPTYSPQISTNYKEAKANFQRNFELQATNITEKNEDQLVNELSENYQTYISDFEEAQTNLSLTTQFYNDVIEPSYQKAQNQLIIIYKVNKDAVLTRNIAAQKVANNNSLLIMTLGFISVGFTLAFILYFPIYITRPLIRLKEKLQAVGNYDYSQQLEIKSTNELGMLASTFNTMVNRLKEYEDSSTAQLISRNQHTQALMNQLQEGVLVLDENLKIVAINNLLAHLIHIEKSENWIGKYAPDMAIKSNLMRKLIAPTLKTRSTDNQTLQPKMNLDNEQDNRQENDKYSRLLRIENQQQEHLYQVTQQRFYTNVKSNKQFAGYIITVKEENNTQPQISLMQTQVFLNQVENTLVELKQNEENEKSLEHINNLIDTTQKFNSTLNGRFNITH